MRCPSPNRLMVSVAAFLVCLGPFTKPARAHCAAPMPVPSTVEPSPLPAGTDWIYPLRWSWLHWWEANRDLYLHASRQDISQEVQPEVIKAQRAKAVAALTDALASKDPALRAAAALSLGQMGESTVAPKLSQLSRSDGNEQVRHTAVIALGLLNDAAGQEALNGLARLAAAWQPVRLRALGLMSGLAPAAVRQMTTWGKRPALPVQVAGVWARSQAGAADAGFFVDVLTRTDNCWLAGEAALGLGRSGNKQSVPILADLLLATDRGQALPSWRRLEAIRLEKLDMAGRLKAIRTRQGTNTILAQFHAEYLQRHAVWNLDSLSPYPPDGVDPRNMIYTIRLGWEEIYMGNLRAAAAIALGGIDSPEACNALMLAVQQAGDEFGGHWNDVNALARAHEFSNLHKGMALISLGRLGNPAALDLLVGTLGGNIVSKVAKTPEEMAHSPLRGCAAIALGLYARPVETPQGPVDRPGFEKVIALLASCAANPNETSEVRCACTLALGLAGRTDSLRLFPPVSDTATKLNDPAQRGLDLLARALLGDRNLVKAAQRMLDTPENEGSTSDAIGRRAVVLALGVYGAQEVIPVLNAAWHQSYFVNREIGNAMALCRGYNATDGLVDLVENGPSSLARVFGARCLADLFMPEGPRRLARFLNGSNYAMRDNSSLFPRALANEFLLNWLIPAFGEIWY